MTVSSMQDLFAQEKWDVYHAEKMLLKAPPRIAWAVSSGKRAERCEAMEGLIEEGHELMEEVEDEAVRDAAIIGSNQKIEHHEIASYGTLIETAKSMGQQAAAKLLR